MNVAIKMTGRLYDEIRRDLERPHPFAFERVGFVFGKVGTARRRRQALCCSPAIMRFPTISTSTTRLSALGSGPTR